MGAAASLTTAVSSMMGITIFATTMVLLKTPLAFAATLPVTVHFGLMIVHPLQLLLLMRVEVEATLLRLLRQVMTMAMAMTTMSQWVSGLVLLLLRQL